MPSALTGEIRPGICRPDWSVLTKPAARDALMGRECVRSGLSEKWGQRLLADAGFGLEDGTSAFYRRWQGTVHAGDRPHDRRVW
jgi:hypothetical protein